MKSSLLLATVLASGLLLAAPSHAQAPGTGGPVPLAAVPLDGGASLLAVSGITYGLRYLRQRRQRA